MVRQREMADATQRREQNTASRATSQQDPSVQRRGGGYSVCMLWPQTVCWHTCNVPTPRPSQFNVPLFLQYKYLSLWYGREAGDVEAGSSRDDRARAHCTRSRSSIRRRYATRAEQKQRCRDKPEPSQAGWMVRYANLSEADTANARLR